MTEAVPPISDEALPIEVISDAAGILRDAGVDIHLPDEGDLDDLERERFEGLCSALAVAFRAGRLRTSEAAKAEVVDRNAVIEECAALIEHGFPGVVGETYAADGVTRSKNDKCLHGQWMYEDCDQCCADAVRTLKSAALHPQRTP